MNDAIGRYRREMDDCDGSEQMSILADALDRLAADVAEIKARADRVALEDVRHFIEAEKSWVSLVEEKRDAAIRERDEARKERDEARGEAERLRAQLAEAIKARDDANAATVKLIEERNAAVTRRDERDKLKALVDELKAACDEARSEAEHLRADLIDALLARVELDKARAEAERLRAELAARPPAAGWLTEDDKADLSCVADVLEHGGWPTKARQVRDIRARAGSPPVVEVPAMNAWGRTVCEEAQAYRTAMDKAGVPWKEVPRE